MNLLKAFKPSPPQPKWQDIVMVFDCRGCMANDHHLMFVGRISGFLNEYASIRVIKDTSINGDIRDYNTDRYEQIHCDVMQYVDGIWMVFK